MLKPTAVGYQTKQMGFYATHVHFKTKSVPQSSASGGLARLDAEMRCRVHERQSDLPLLRHQMLILKIPLLTGAT